MRKWEKVMEGFTIVELSLSIAFIGVLSITVVLMINQTVASYNRGLLLDQVNTTGMDLVDEFRYAVQNSSRRSVTAECSVYYQEGNTDYNNCVNDGAVKFVSISKYATVNDNGGKSLGSLPVFGAFCTGTYSYIWNSGYLFNEKNDAIGKATLKYKDTDGTARTYSNAFRLLKVRDEVRGVCVSAVKSGYNDSAISNNFDITGYNAVDESPVDLLSQDGQNNLVVYDLAAAAPKASNASNSLFYSVSFILGTIRGGININTTGDYCVPPGGNNAKAEDFTYCAINKFNFAVQATGE